MTNALQDAEGNIKDDSQKTRAGLDNLKTYNDEYYLLQQVLQSLSFPNMLAREESIDPAFANTFDWIFHCKDRDLRPSVHGSSASKGVDLTDVSEYQLIQLLQGFEGQISDHVSCGMGHVHEPLEELNFVPWLRGDDHLFWINGKAGSGKSTLMRFLTEDSRLKENLSAWTSDRRLIILHHFFWSAGSVEQKSINGLLRKLVHQLLVDCPHLLEALGLDLCPAVLTWTNKRLTKGKKFCTHFSPVRKKSSKIAYQTIFKLLVFFSHSAPYLGSL